MKPKNKVIMINLIILLVVIFGSLIWDIFLSLGEYAGLVFAIFLAYASGAFFIVNLILAIISRYRKHLSTARGYGISAIVMPTIALVVAFIGGRIVW